jgi:putative pyruvate formate lyase activating enzyme
LKENNPKKVLQNYQEVMVDNQLSRWETASLIPADNFGQMQDMWQEHERIRKEFHLLYPEIARKGILKRPEFSYQDIKVEIAEKMLECCVLCEMRCKVDRNFEKGSCGVQNSLIASEFLHRGEEPPLVPSHTIFFAGCNFQCVYCQNWDISQHPEDGMPLSEARLADVIDRRRTQGSRNVNFVGGDPTPHLPFILKTMHLSQENNPVVWNSNLYLSEEAMKLLDGFADLYLTDFKYGNDDCALRLSGVQNYWEVVTRNHKLAWQAGDMIIRHLVLPNHIQCCTKPILKWIYHNLGPEVVINIMGQYRPVYGACKHEDISRTPSRGEMEEALNYARDLGFMNIL